MQANDLMSLFTDLVIQAFNTPSGTDILAECLAVAATLVEKNRKDGDAALNPIRIFSKAGPVEQILVRIDDKINRLKQGENDDTEDVFKDLLGYLVLFRIAQRRHAEGAQSGKVETSKENPGVTSLNIDAGEAPFQTKTRVAAVRPEGKRVEVDAKVSTGACQDCACPVEENVAVCDVCYQRRFGRNKIDLSHVPA